jgi:hypothetical protein
MESKIIKQKPSSKISEKYYMPYKAIKNNMYRTQKVETFGKVLKFKIQNYGRKF